MNSSVWGFGKLRIVRKKISFLTTFEGVFPTFYLQNKLHLKYYSVCTKKMFSKQVTAIQVIEFQAEKFEKNA